MLLILSMSLIAGSPVWAKAAKIDYEKATLVSKLAKYVQWSTEARQDKFVIGVYEDQGKYEYFSDFFKNKGVKNKDILVRLVNSYSEAKNVDILYISSPNSRKSLKLTSRIINRSHILIVTEDIKDISNTMVDLSYDKEKSKINFKLIESNVADGKLTIPELSKFLSAKDNDEILSVSPTFALETQQSQQLLALQKQIDKQKSLLNQLNKNLNLSKKNLEKERTSLQKQSKSLDVVQQADKNKSQIIKSQNEKLQSLEAQLQAQKKQLQIKQQTSLQVTAKETTLEPKTIVVDLSKELKAENESLQKQNEELQKQNDITKNTVIALTSQAKKNKGQKSFQTLFYTFLIISIIALVVALLMWKKAKISVSKLSPQLENESNSLLLAREHQLIKSENFAALGYIATDITYAIALSLDDLQAQFESASETQHIKTLKPVIALLKNFNLIAADQDETTIQSFDVIAYIQKMLMLYDFEFSQSNIIYSYSGEQELTIKSVPSYIALVLLNLINNSLKHGFDNNGNGNISIKVAKEAKKGAKIIYFDNGKGMDKATLEQVFTPFFTTQSERDYVGIGMSTTYDLIKNKLAGEIKIDSQEGKGTTVTITLP